MYRSLLRLPFCHSFIFLDRDREKEAPGTLQSNTRRVLSSNKPTPTKKKKSASNSKEVFRQRVDLPQVNGSRVSKNAQEMKKSKTLKKKQVALSNENFPAKVMVYSYECDVCQKTFQLRSSLLKHKYYCPTKKSACN